VAVLSAPWRVKCRLTYCSHDSGRFLTRIRVKAPVAQRPPLFPVREDSPHTVLRFRPFLPSRQPIRRPPDGRVTVLPSSRYRYPCALYWNLVIQFVALRVPPVVPLRKKSHPASLSFPTVGRLGHTSPPYHSGIYGPEYRYYDRLRLPNVHSRFVRFWGPGISSILSFASAETISSRRPSVGRMLRCSFVNEFRDAYI
jgi:hypothetical protein